MSFQLQASYLPTGDQPNAINQLVKGVRQGIHAQTLLGVTGSGKTFTMASVIQRLNVPTLIISHNKTLAGQLYSEFKQFFPNNAVEYFISYYDYYQPEAYLPTTKVYIEKASSINQEIEKMRLKTVSSLRSGRRDVIVIASVACIYGMTNPLDFSKYTLEIKTGERVSQKKFLLKLVDLLYQHTKQILTVGNFRVCGDKVDLYPSYTDYALRFSFFGDEIEQIHRIAPTTGQRLGEERKTIIFPANLFVTNKETIRLVSEEVRVELAKQVAFFEQKNQFEEAQRIKERTELDLEMLQELGYCPGIENYSPYFDKRSPEERPYCLIDYFPEDFLLLVDESHVSIPQVKAMWGGDRKRKKHLVEYGYRLPSAMGNRPLTLPEVEKLINQVIFVSATPSDYELNKSEGLVVEQLIRPTGLLDPTIHIEATRYQIDHLLAAIQERVARKERVLIVTLTKDMAEKLSKYLSSRKLSCCYLHSEIKTLDRAVILEKLREGTFDILVGVNLLREGIDLPEVSLVIILDADKEGFLRNTRSLIQIIGRAARHVNGHVIMYADKITPAMQVAIEETNRRRGKQQLYNIQHNITPTSVQKAFSSLVRQQTTAQTYQIFTEERLREVAASETPYEARPNLQRLIAITKRRLREASAATDYIAAQQLKEELEALQKQVQTEE